MVELPPDLAVGIDRQLRGVSQRDLARASADLSAQYRQKQEHRAPVARTEAAVLAYAATRLPATYAAVTSALRAARDRRPDWEPASLLDLGAGPGTAAWSATTVWPSIQQIAAVETEPSMVALGNDLARSAHHPAIQSATWTRASLLDAAPAGQHDLVILAYVLAELEAGSQDRVVDLAAAATATPAGLTVVVEPGTPEGYRRVLRARERLLAGGASVIAPCPHSRACPMSETDWCHFAVRLPRSAMHRAAKGADLGYEDEKFAYVAASREPTPPAPARVLRHPQVRPRHIQLELCTPGGLASLAVTKRDGDRFRLARKVGWGDNFTYTVHGAPQH